jgi:hypothetical protein
MTPEQWQQIKFFSPSENWGDASRMAPQLIQELDHLRRFLGCRIIIHCGYEPRDGKGFHPQGLAVDCHAENWGAVDFFLAALRFGFTGLGIYTWWDHPGLHLDWRPVADIKPFRSLWGSTGPKEYVSLDGAFIKQALGVM